MSAEIAAQLRAQIRTSTDPAWLERMAREVEGKTGPRRLQGQRTKLPANAVWVGPNSVWENQYEKSYIGGGGFDAAGRMIALPKTPENVVRWYRQDLTENRTPASLAWHLAPLRGKDLVCRCELGELCHADVLLELLTADIVDAPRDSVVHGRDEKA